MQRRHEPPIKPKSAALLAAEAAFAPARHTNEQQFAQGKPQVTVLRAKGLAASVERADSNASASPGSNPLSEPLLSEPKAPRVFLLTSSHVESGPTLPEGPPHDAQADETGPAAVLGLRGKASAPVRRARQSRLKPSPVTLVFSAPASVRKDDGHGPERKIAVAQAQAQAKAQVQTQAHDDSLAHLSASLATALAGVEPTFVAISSARSFSVDDPQITAQWERLSEKLQHLAIEIKALSAEAGFSVAPRSDSFAAL